MAVVVVFTKKSFRCGTSLMTTYRILRMDSWWRIGLISEHYIGGVSCVFTVFNYFICKLTKPLWLPLSHIAGTMCGTVYVSVDRPVLEFGDNSSEHRYYRGWNNWYKDKNEGSHKDSLDGRYLLSVALCYIQLLFCELVETGFLQLLVFGHFTCPYRFSVSVNH